MLHSTAVADDLQNALAIVRTHDEERELEVAEIEVFPTVRVLEGDPPPPPSVHVTDLLIDEDISMITGPGGTAKSTIALHVAACVVLGRPVFGTLTVRRPCPVLLLLPEDGERVARMMLDAITAGMGLSADDRQRLAAGLHMITDDVSVDLTKHTLRLGQTMRERGAGLLIADPLRNLLGSAAENDNDVAGACMDAVRRHICRGASASVLLLHHTRKPGKEQPADAALSVHDMRGGGGWANGARLVLGVSKHDCRLTITGLKANRVRANLRHEVALSISADAENAAHWTSCRLVDANGGSSSDTLTPGTGRPLNANEQELLAALDDTHEPGKRWSYSGWRNAAGLSDSTFSRLYRRLLDAKLVGAEATERKRQNADKPVFSYALTDAGREQILRLNLQPPANLQPTSSEGSTAQPPTSTPLIGVELVGGSVEADQPSELWSEMEVHS